MIRKFVGVPPTILFLLCAKLSRVHMCPTHTISRLLGGGSVNASFKKHGCYAFWSCGNNAATFADMQIMQDTPHPQQACGVFSRSTNLLSPYPSIP